MRSRYFVLALATVLAGSTVASAQRQWIVYANNYRNPNSGSWGVVTGGDYDGRDYKYYAAPAQNVEWNACGFYDLVPGNAIPISPNTDEFPAKPGLYQVEQWSPSIRPAEVTAWSWVPVEVTFCASGSDDSGEAGSMNMYLPWLGAYGTNHQYFGSGLAFPSTSPGEWKQQGSNHVPANATCAAAATGTQAWLRRNALLYIYWNPFPYAKIARPLTALRVTEVYSEPVTFTDPTVGGPVDLRRHGNADPVYGVGENYTNNWKRSLSALSIDSEKSLGATGFAMGSCVPVPDTMPEYKILLTSGLPATGIYTAHLPTRDVTFQLNYNGLNTVKWVSNSTDFPQTRVLTLNGTAGQDFVPGTYATVNLLTASSGGLGHRLAVEAVYNDSTSETVYTNLYDWFNNNGDPDSVAVGFDGYTRASGANGLRRIHKQGYVDDGANPSGAFLFAHRVAINPCKTLTRINVTTSFPSAPQFVVESRTGGYNEANFATAGGWNQDTPKSNVGEVTQGIGCLWAGAGQAGTTATFSFTPVVTAYYDAFATWANSLNEACTATAFTVTHDGAPVTVLRNQREGGNGWQHLGQYHLTAGTTYSVTVDSGQSTGGNRVYADAVRWQTPGISANLLAVTLETGGCCDVPWADTDADQDVDMVDFAALQRCLTIAHPGIALGCECLDSNKDGIVDSVDVTNFAACSMGPDVDFINSLTPPYWPNWPVGCPGEPAQ